MCMQNYFLQSTSQYPADYKLDGVRRYYKRKKCEDLTGKSNRAKSILSVTILEERHRCYVFPYFNTIVLLV